jgi:hypothetical protein
VTHDPLCRYARDAFTGAERCDCTFIAKIRTDEVVKLVELIKAAKARRKITLWDRIWGRG